MYYIALLGVATGMRTMTGIAVVCWAAYLGYLPVEGTWAFWTAKLVSVVVFTILALGEYYGDTLPTTPSRKKWPLVLGRLMFGILVGVIVSTALGQPAAGGTILAVLGVLIGIYGGYRFRMAGARLFKRDLPMALLESAVALGLCLLAFDHIYEDATHYSRRSASVVMHVTPHTQG